MISRIQPTRCPRATSISTRSTPNWANSAAAALIALATGAAATPPRVVNVTDTLFARNDGTLLLLRTVTDNMGYHQVTQTDTMVVFRSLADGTDVGFAPVERVTDYGADSGEDRVMFDNPVAATNPYQIRAEHGAWPLHHGDYGTIEVTLDSAGLHLSAQWPDRTFGLSLADLQARVEQTLQSVRTVAPAVESTVNADTFDPAAYDVGTDCVADGRRSLFHRPDDPALVHLSCEQIDTGQQVRLWIVVPQL